MTFRRLNQATHPELANISFKSDLDWTRHGSTRATEKGVPIYDNINIAAGQVVEVEYENNKMTKVVVRFPLTFREDAVLVIKPLRQAEALVITCWTNEKSDTHRTLDPKRITA